MAQHIFPIDLVEPESCRLTTGGARLGSPEGKRRRGHSCSFARSGDGLLRLATTNVTLQLLPIGALSFASSGL
jgi:hypothetical protein